MGFMQTPAPRCMLPCREHRTELTVQEFKDWLKKFDTDGDGRISRKELREAIRHRGARFSKMRALFAVWQADRNHNGFVDDSEIDSLIEFAEKDLGFKITMDVNPPAGLRVNSAASPYRHVYMVY